MSNPMFPAGEDLPIFSGTPMRASIEAFDPDHIDASQARFASCSICFDTGVVTVKGKQRKCWCIMSPKSLLVDPNDPWDEDKPPRIAKARARARRRHEEERFAEIASETSEAEEAQALGDEDRAKLKALPKSKRLARVQHNAREAYPEQSDTEHVLREALALELAADRFNLVGAQGMSTLELLTLLLNEKTPTVAARIIAQFQTLARVHHAPISQLAAISGMTRRRATILHSALELASRRDATVEPPMIKTPQDVADLVGPAMRGLDHEEMRVISLSTKNRIVDSSVIYRGSVHTTVIRVGELFRIPLFTNAAAVIIMHNHPSGDASPSPEDVAVTREIVQAGKLLDIDVLDHIVIGDPGFVSLKERGLGFG